MSPACPGWIQAVQGGTIITAISHATHCTCDGGSTYRVDRYTGKRAALISEGLATAAMLKGIGSSWRLSRQIQPEAGMWVTHKLPGSDWLLVRTSLLEQVPA